MLDREQRAIDDDAAEHDGARRWRDHRRADRRLDVDASVAGAIGVGGCTERFENHTWGRPGPCPLHSFGLGLGLGVSRSSSRCGRIGGREYVRRSRSGVGGRKWGEPCQKEPAENAESAQMILHSGILMVESAIGFPARTR